MSIPLSWGQVHPEEDYKDRYWLVGFKTTAQLKEEAMAAKEREVAGEEKPPSLFGRWGPNRFSFFLDKV